MVAGGLLIVVGAVLVILEGFLWFESGSPFKTEISKPGGKLVFGSAGVILIVLGGIFVVVGAKIAT